MKKRVSLSITPLFLALAGRATAPSWFGARTGVLRVATRSALIVVGFGLALMVAGGLAHPGFASAAVSPPQVVSLSYSPSSVDVTNGSASVTFTAHLTDGSPITYAYVGLSNRSNPGQQVSAIFSRTSGTATDGTWQATVQVPQGDGAGTWDYSGSIQDASNYVGYSSGPGTPSNLPASAPGPLTVTDGPPAPVITTPGDGSALNSHSVSVSGTGEAGTAITISAGSTIVGSATSDGSRAWSTTLTGVADGAHAYTATATDAAGNTSLASSVVHITVDTQAPAAPVITTPGDGTPPAGTTTVTSPTGGGAVTSPAGSGTVTSPTATPPRNSSPLVKGSNPKPKLTALVLAPAAFVAAKSGPSASAKRFKTGTTIAFKLSKRATVTFKIELQQPGRKGHGRCVVGSKAKHAVRCVRVKALTGSFRWTARAGTDRLSFSGRLAGRALRPGRYLLIAVPDTGATSEKAFQIRS